MIGRIAGQRLPPARARGARRSSASDGDRHGHVVLDRRPERLLGLGDAFAQRPEPGALRRASRRSPHRARGRPRRPRRAPAPGRRRRSRRRGPASSISPNQSASAASGSAGRQVDHEVERRARDQLPGGEPLGGVLAQQREQRGGGRDGGEGDPGGGARAGVAGCRREDRGGDDAERALGADEELLQVVAGVVLAQRPQPVPDAAVGQHHLEPEHQARASCRSAAPRCRRRWSRCCRRSCSCPPSRGTAGTAGRPRPRLPGRRPARHPPRP